MRLRASATVTGITAHGGAGPAREQNSMRSLQAAVAAGADRIEFDVLRFRGRLVVAHDSQAAAARPPLDLDEALAWLATTGLGLVCDMKGSGHAAPVADALVRHGLVARTTVCGAGLPALQAMRKRAPGLTVGWTVPESKGTPGRTVPGPVRHALLLGWRWRLPSLARARVADGACDGLMVHQHLVTRRLTAHVHDAGGFVQAWTVDEPKAARRLARLGVDGLTTNDPAAIRAALA